MIKVIKEKLPLKIGLKPLYILITYTIDYAAAKNIDCRVDLYFLCYNFSLKQLPPQVHGARSSHHEWVNDVSVYDSRSP